MTTGDTTRSPATPFGRRARAFAMAAALGVSVAAVVSWRAIEQRLGPPPFAAADELSTVVVDRKDRLLRAFTTPDGRWRLPATLADVDPRYVAMLKAFEDRRFDRHAGVDPLALGRAAVQLAANGRIVSGGSTLTMQVARLLDGRHERTASGKLEQMVRAMQIERTRSKDQILDLYLRLAPFGGNIEGVRAASLAYFGKEPKRLSVGEAALLVALPQSPEARRPDRHAEAARRARDRVLDRALEAGVINAAEALRAKDERVPTARREFPKYAPHLSEAEIAAQPKIAVHRLTIDRELQAALETLAAEHVKALPPKLSTALLVIDNATGEVLAHVGSAGYLDDARFGAIDMIEAVRSPGSTLKPFVYGLGFEQGLAHPETLIEDRPVRFGAYAPKNFDEDFQGTVTIRTALAQSLNIPAVKVLDAIDPQRLVGRLKRAGVAPELPQGAEPSLAIALGGVGLRMRDLASLYLALARGGAAVDLKWRRASAVKATLMAHQTKRARRLLGTVASWYVTDILKDAPPPPAAAGGRIAYKTGTSYGYRDAWAIGYDGRHTVAVWVGRPDSASTPGLMGRTAAAPILFDAFARLGERRYPLPARPDAALAVTGADLPPPLKRFREPGHETAAAPGAFLDPPVAIVFPPDRAEIEGGDDQPVVIRAEGGALPLTWLADGVPLAVEPGRRELAWEPDGRGFVRLTVIDAKGRADRVTVRLR